MLNKAKISHTDPQPIDKDAGRPNEQPLPEDSVAIMTTRYEQPFNGGYGFFTEFVFNKNGELLAIWGWE